MFPSLGDFAMESGGYLRRGKPAAHLLQRRGDNRLVGTRMAVARGLQPVEETWQQCYDADATKLSTRIASGSPRVKSVL